MNKIELINALKLAKSDKKEKLGKFGLGMKTAASSIGEHFEIFTSKKGERLLFKAVYDKEQWSNLDKWQMDIHSIEKKDPEKHGTIIKINKLLINASKRIAPLRMDFGQRFAPYINSKLIQIKVNKKVCKAKIPEIDNDIKTDFTLDLSFGTINGWYALLRKGSQKEHYGFNTFRYGRMITAYDKIGFKPHPTVSRIMGEIQMNHVPVTHNKREWIKESKEYQEVEDAMKNELSEILKFARKQASEESVNKFIREILEIWKDGIYQALKVDELKLYQKPEAIGEIGKNEKVIDKDNIEIEKRESPEFPSSPQKEPTTTKERHPNVTQIVKRNTIMIKGKKFEFEHYFAELGEDAGWKDYKIDENTKIVQIYTNTDFPAWKTTKDKPFYAFMHIVETISEIIITLSNESLDKYKEIKDILLRNASAYFYQIKKE
jgi:hypothetical protein